MTRLVDPRLAAVLVLGACAPGPADDAAAFSRAVVNGQTATSCQFPSAVLVDMADAVCSGTLVHPRLVTLAGHCGEGGAVNAVLFGEDAMKPTRTVKVSSCKFYPNFRMDVNDVGYCVLAEPVNDVPIAPVMMGCETAALQRGAKVDLVGFGLISHQRKDQDSWGIKRWASVPILNNVGATTSGIEVGAGSTTGCDGDSGGPIFMRLADGTWRTVGVASTTAINRAGECVPPTTYVLLSKWIGWIEQSSGIDVTPCHDADGTWNPGPGCGGFATSVDQTTGTWASGCGGPAALSGPGGFCGGGDGGVVGDDGGADASPDLTPDLAPPDLAPPPPDAQPDTDRAPPAVVAPPDAALPTAAVMGKPGGGCSCETAGRDRGPGLGLLLLLGLAWAQRRRAKNLGTSSMRKSRSSATRAGTCRSGGETT